jgi:type I restriction enzyme M protein
MSEEQRRQLQQQLWKIADELRGKMHADEFRDYMLGFIFYKYLSEKMQRYADNALTQDERLFSSLNESNETDALMIAAVKPHALSAHRIVSFRCAERQLSVGKGGGKFYH